jgi:hypothetical protein
LRQFLNFIESASPTGSRSQPEHSHEWLFSAE